MVTVDGDGEFNETIVDTETNEPALSEDEAAIRKLQNGKATGIDSITLNYSR